MILVTDQDPKVGSDKKSRSKITGLEMILDRDLYTSGLKIKDRKNTFTYHASNLKHISKHVVHFNSSRQFYQVSVHNRYGERQFIFRMEGCSKVASESLFLRGVATKSPTLIVSEMTYNVSSGTLNPTIQCQH